MRRTRAAFAAYFLSASVYIKTTQTEVIYKVITVKTKTRGAMNHSSILSLNVPDLTV